MAVIFRLKTQRYFSYNIITSFIVSFFPPDDLICCHTMTTWTCSRQHSFPDIPQCQQGLPVQCPDCVLEDRDKLIIPKFQLPSELVGFNRTPLQFEKHLDGFNQNQHQVIFHFELWSQKLKMTQRPLCRPRIFNCFIPLREDQSNVNAFEPR